MKEEMKASEKLVNLQIFVSLHCTDACACTYICMRVNL